MSINRKLKRKQNNPMVKIFIEAEVSSLFSENKETLKIYSYSKTFFKDSEEFLLLLTNMISRIQISVHSKIQEQVSISEFLDNAIKSNIEEFNYVVRENKIFFNNDLVSLNTGEVVINNYKIYFGNYTFFEDLNTNKKYMFDLQNLTSKKEQNEELE